MAMFEIKNIAFFLYLFLNIQNYSVCSPLWAWYLFSFSNPSQGSPFTLGGNRSKALRLEGANSLIRLQKEQIRCHEVNFEERRKIEFQVQIFQRKNEKNFKFF